MNILYIFLICISFIILIFCIWHIASQKIPCPFWLSWLLEIENPFTKVNRSTFIIQHLNFKPGIRILDAGCGSGRLTIPIAKKINSQGTIVAMDIQKEMLDKVKQKAKVNNLHNVEFVNAGLGDGTLEHNTFDYVLLITVLGEISNQKKALQEIYDALKIGGSLIISETIFDPHFQKKETVNALAQTIGFQEKNYIKDRFGYFIEFEK